MTSKSTVLDAVRPGNTTDSTDPTESTDETFDALTAGLTGGAIATAVMSAFRIPIATSPPPPAWFWSKFVGPGDPEDYPAEGAVLHLLYGVVGGCLFGLIADPIANRSAADRKRICTALGGIYGAVLSAFGIVVLMDRLLGLDMEHDEEFVFHVSHAVYGLTLGAWVGTND